VNEAEGARPIWVSISSLEQREAVGWLIWRLLHKWEKAYNLTAVA